MTIKQFLNLGKMTDSDTRLRFRFKDKQGVDWIYEDFASEFSGFYILEFPCNLKCKEENLYTFDLDLNKIPTDMFTTFSEVYEQPARKSEGKKTTVQEYLNELQKCYSHEKQPKVFFRQKILIKDSDEKDTHYNGLRFDTENAVCLEEAVNGPFSHLFVDNVEIGDDTIFIDLVTTVEKELKNSNNGEQIETDKGLNDPFDPLLLISSIVLVAYLLWLLL